MRVRSTDIHLPEVMDSGYVNYGTGITMIGLAIIGHVVEAVASTGNKMLSV